MVIIPISTLPVDNYMSAPHNIRPLTSCACWPLKTSAAHNINHKITTSVGKLLMKIKKILCVDDQEDQEVAVNSHIYTQI